MDDPLVSARLWIIGDLRADFLFHSEVLRGSSVAVTRARRKTVGYRAPEGACQSSSVSGARQLLRLRREAKLKIIFRQSVERTRGR